MRLANQLQPSRLKALPARLYATCHTEQLARADLLHVNTRLLAQLGLEQWQLVSEENFFSFTGSPSAAQLQAISTVYAGHQFGIYTSKLGDGRVHILGDVIASDGHPWEVQLKGAGATPFARGNSGRMSLAEAITEYLGCEAMAGLGIPSTRALALIRAGDDEPDRRANECILVRTAPSHLRFGHFEYWHNQQDLSVLKQLADHVITQHYPALLRLAEKDRYLAFLYAVTQRTAQLLAQWQAVGFVHSVMNTDNMSILGLTLDYGVYGFMQVYEPGYSANANDEQHRYAFDQQVEVARWNCLALAEALIELLPAQRIPASLLRHFRQEYADSWQTLMRKKLGLSATHPQDAQLIATLLQLLQQQRVDYTRFFRRLSHVARFGEAVMADLIPNWAAFRCWFAEYQQCLRQETITAEARGNAMLAHNPRYVLRQQLLKEAIQRSEQAQDFTMLQDLLHVLQSPYAEHEKYEYLA
jgi:uncharacterized protein YdiU (UPF0061 family)